MLKTIIAFTFLIAIGTATNDIWLNEDHEPGFIKVRKDGSDLFYWLMKSRNAPKTDPLVFWLSGGPGEGSEE